MNNVSFKGKISFVNTESYKNFVGYRKQINALKHHCGNRSLALFIQHDKNFFAVTTIFEHERKIDGIASHALSDVTSSPKAKNIAEIIKTHISKIKNWKSKIDKIPVFVDKKNI